MINNRALQQKAQGTRVETLYVYCSFGMRVRLNTLQRLGIMFLEFFEGNLEEKDVQLELIC